MPIAVVCPSCDRKATAPDRAAGHQVHCPKCRAVLTVPCSAEAPTTAVPVVEVVEPLPLVQAVPLIQSAAGVGRASRRGPVEVQVSARVLSWPGVCPCCLGPADTSLKARHERETGVRVVHTDTRWWDVPYCQACLDHLAWGREARGRRAQARALYVKAVWIPLLVFALAFILGGCALAPRHGADTPDSERLTTGLALLTLGVTAAAVALVVVLLLARAAASSAREAAANAEASRSPSCSSTASPAVVYTERQGTVHTFHFANPDYAEAFCAANAGKVLG